MKGKTIESYWVGSFQNSPLELFINEKDEGALESLLNIYSLNDTKDINTVSYRFVFKANPFFQETTAVRRLKLENGKPVSL